ncbi:MAG: sigma 54-interacting transcriptional regulator, partial [Desulfuromonadaceae bacterium]|nr:sigma 54-interacting transcriptional regulator [Desulfuromonadaceae bacterium]
MAKEQNYPNSKVAGELRRQAERLLAKRTGHRPNLSEVEKQRLVHELEVHQIELEMQNAELRRAQQELESLVNDRTEDLTAANRKLTQEIEERRTAETNLQSAFTEIKQLTEKLRVENIELKQVLTRGDDFSEIIGQSPAISYVFYRIDQVAPQDTTVLLHGETGSGKGLVARAIHRRSSRKDRPMITVNCTALPGNLIESELFGREKGAFTGAHARQLGRFELADGGTIFLDEIGEMPLELQVKLLRVLQDGEFERLGSPRTIKVDVRVIAASNRNLEEEIKAGRFREDLFYRLSVFPVTIPPLRQRSEDIPLLVNHFVAKYNRKTGKQISSVSKETLHALQDYHWPGNVRELESIIERAVITSPGNALQVQDRFETFRKPETQDVKALADLERDHILQVLQKTGWRIEGKNGAALLRGLNPSTLR